MGSVRRISLVGKHKRAQSGGGFVVPSSPGPSSGGFFNRSSSGAVFSSSGKEPVPPPLPFSLPPLPTSASQLSLRLPEASGSSYSLHHQQQPLNHPNLHLTSRRIVSASSGRSEASSVFPSSTVSGGSGSVSGSHSRSTGGGLQRTPSGKVRKRSKSRTRRSEDGLREQQGGANGSTARRPSATAKTERRSLDFVFESGVEATNQQPQVLLPPIELQPPSPPRTLTQSSAEPMIDTPKGKLKETTKTNNTRSLASALTAFDLNTLSPGALSPTFSPVPSSPLSVSALAPPKTPQPTSPATSSSSLFFTPTGSPYPPASPNKLGVVAAGHSPGKQSASLGRATASGVIGADGSPGGKGAAAGVSGGGGASGGGVPRRNSLGDLKIPARISQAQVGLRRDLGMVREFATNIERSCLVFFLFLSLTEFIII